MGGGEGGRGVKGILAREKVEVSSPENNVSYCRFTPRPAKLVGRCCAVAQKSSRHMYLCTFSFKALFSAVNVFASSSCETEK